MEKLLIIILLFYAWNFHGFSQSTTSKSGSLINVKIITWKIDTIHTNVSRNGLSKTTKNSKVPKDKQKVKCLFIGVYNPLKVELNNIGSEIISFTFEDGLVRKENGNYFILTNKIGLKYLTVYIDGIEFLKYPYFVRRAPDPAPGFLNICRDGNVGKNTFFKVNRLIICDGDSLNFFNRYFPDARIVSFQIWDRERKIEYTSTGNSLTDEQISYVKKLKSGEKLKIYNIKANLFNKEHQLGTLTLRVY